MSRLITALKLANWNIRTQDAEFYPLPREAGEA